MSDVVPIIASIEAKQMRKTPLPPFRVGDSVKVHVLIREGLSGFTMERLAEAAEISRPTAYQHFGSREGALASTAASTIALCSRLFEASCRFRQFRGSLITLLNGPATKANQLK